MTDQRLFRQGRAAFRNDHSFDDGHHVLVPEVLLAVLGVEQAFDDDLGQKNFLRDLAHHRGVDRARVLEVVMGELGRDTDDRRLADAVSANPPTHDRASFADGNGVLDIAAHVGQSTQIAGEQDGFASVRNEIKTKVS